jgi:hypothetical protein
MSESAEVTAKNNFFEIVQQNREHEVIFRIPASENYPWGEEVGWVKDKDGWLYAVIFNEDGEVQDGNYAIKPGRAAPFPRVTSWCITDNDALDHGLES